MRHKASITIPQGYRCLHVLIVDDVAHIRSMVRSILRHLGLERVSEAGSVDEAFQIIRTLSPDIVFTDWEMPNGCGLELVHKIRTHPASPDPALPVVMLTAHGSHEHVTIGRNAGVTDFLVKPVSPARIVERLLDVVNRQRPFVISPGYRGPDRRRTSRPVAVDRRFARSGEKGVILVQPDNLLLARVSGDEAAVQQARRQKEGALSLIARTLPGAEETEETARRTLGEMIDTVLTSFDRTADVLLGMIIPLQQLRQAGMASLPPSAERVVVSLQRILTEGGSLSGDLGLMRLHLLALRAMLNARQTPDQTRVAEELAARIEDMARAKPR
ncbi:CheY-like chemotaxis protein [Azospirillum fermentarium]|uniref:response regulator n=1 Tax=Azospirillum fermentarium TaxID=1233114 RepID=UPI00222625AF|nr:response regulator [Azospirillum fermentarium]MCW2248168.1 CheY-like chemotaxis protein [Azospirillum fermentarium]